MAEQLNYQINVSGNAGESVGSLRKQLRQAENELGAISKKFGETSKEAVIAAQKTAQLKDQIAFARSLTEAFNPDQKFRALSASLSGVAGGFAAIQGAIGLFGGESKELEKQLLKVQSALALSQGLESIGNSIDSFKQLGLVIQSTTIFTKANQAANIATASTMRALGIAADTTAVSFRVLKTAIASTGILLAVVAIGELVSALMNYTSASEKAAKKQKELNEQISATEEIANNAVKEFISSSAELEELRAVLAGKGEEEILAIRKKALQDQIQANKKSYDELIKVDKVKASALIDENSKLQDEITKLELNAQIKRNENNKQQREKNKQEKEKEEAAENQRMIAQAERESAAQKVQIDAFRATLTQREQDILRAEDELEAKRSTLIRAGNFDFQKIEEENRIKIAEINAKYDKEELDNKNALLEKKREADEKEVERKKEYEERKREFELESQQLTEELQSKREQLLLNGLNVLGAIAGENEKIANTIFAIQKGLEIAKVVSSASASIGQIIASTQAIPPILPPGVPNPAYISAVALGAKRAAIVKVGAAAQIAGIAATSISRFKNGGAGAIGGSVSGEAANAPLSPQSTTTNLSQSTINAIGNSAIRAYVVETDITGNQKRIQAIKQRARFS